MYEDLLANVPDIRVSAPPATGGTGFLGANVKPVLAKQYDVTNLHYLLVKQIK